MKRWWDALVRGVFGLGPVYPEEPLVCVTHLRFLPCRRCDQGPQGKWSAHPDAVEAVRVYQHGEAP